ncbi:MAG: hypothetical protein IJ763_07895 [Lachnospiraceae bacterium]|nr:hypothetical protein [Lachnospiraceae bacterium]
MEFIHSLADGRKAIIYDEGNNIILIFMTNTRNMQSAVVARDYLSSLDCVYFRNNIYIVYISNTNEVKFRQIGSDETLVLISDANEVWNVSDLQLFVINEKIYLSYQIYNKGDDEHEIRYINPRGDRKSKLMLSKKDRIYEYSIFTANEEIYLKVRYEAGKAYEFYRLSIDGSEDIVLSQNYLIDDNERKRYEKDINDKLDKIEADKNDLKEQISKEYEDKLNQEMDKLKTELDEKRAEEIRSLEENYTRQYNELSDMTKQIQEEGKQYRDMYIQTLDVLEKIKNERRKSVDIIDTKKNSAAKARKTAKQSTEKADGKNIGEKNEIKKDEDIAVKDKEKIREEVSEAIDDKIEESTQMEKKEDIKSEVKKEIKKSASRKTNKDKKTLENEKKSDDEKKFEDNYEEIEKLVEA